jgi:hypothetical protein
MPSRHSALTWSASISTGTVIARSKRPATRSRNSSIGALIEEVRFASDAPVEEAGFEPSVPL